MPKAHHRAVPILVAGVFGLGVIAAPAAGATVQRAPAPADYPWCDLDFYCNDDPLSNVIKSDLAPGPASRPDSRPNTPDESGPAAPVLPNQPETTG